MNLLSARFAILAVLSLSVARAANTVTYEGKEGPGKGRHIVLLSGDEEYRSEEGLPQLAKILSQRHGFTCTVVFSINPQTGEIDPNTTNNEPGVEALDKADLCIMLLRFRQWPDAQMKHFVDYYLAGKPIVALRTSTHAFNFKDGAYKDYNSFGKRVLGEGWVSHWGRHKSEATRGIIEGSAKDSPILKGVEDVFGTTDVYEAHPPADATILMRGQVLKGMTPGDAPADYKKKRATDKEEQGVNEPMMPVVWTREYRNEAGKTNRILCTTMGAATDLESEGLRRLLVNGAYWGLGMADRIPAKADVALVGDYKPTFYGFKGFKPGTKPSDYEVK